MSTTTETVRDEAPLSVPAGFRRATAADLTDRPCGWVGPKIHAPYLVDGRPETAATVAWTPDEGMAPILNEDVYPNMDSPAAEDAFERLQMMLTYAALEAEATSPSELAKAYRASDDNLYNFPAPWDHADSAATTLVEEVMSAHEVIGGGAAIGLQLQISLDEFERLGLDMVTEGDLLQLTGTRDEITRAADVFAAMGTKLQAFLNKQPVE
ncbi:hypothetical protein [Pseudarthrobacter sp. ATCC 49987]|uniref:hypothetical protein n=1 Tax=Pseudarthrobacter sp. ATCC 49987 TaxID=2698204 RepID=UPI00136F6A67|nr:hypothetical protein [Pseudarthrobacter sp. ATCC 49987]